MATIEDFFVALQYPWVYKPLIIGFIIGVVCSIIGVFIILRGLVFFGNGIAHSAFAGGTLGILLNYYASAFSGTVLGAIFQLPPLFFIFIFAVSTAMAIGFIQHRTKLTNETTIGILFAFTMALGIIFISLFRTYNTSVSSFLFGSISAISVNEIIIAIVFSAIIIPVIAIIKKPLYFITFDEELAKSSGIRVVLISFVFLLVVALTIIMSITVVGIILVMAYIVTPAATAYQFTYKINLMILYSIIFASIGAFLGIMIAYILSISGSATIAIILTINFIISMILSPKRRLKLPNVDEPYCKTCEKMIQDIKCQYCQLENESFKAQFQEDEAVYLGTEHRGDST
ncbi:MAG: metal ABC transporter permease [Promethearchaeota archaeon]